MADVVLQLVPALGVPSERARQQLLKQLALWVGVRLERLPFHEGGLELPLLRSGTKRRRTPAAANRAIVSAATLLLLVRF